MEVTPEQEAKALEQMFTTWVERAQTNLRVLQQIAASGEQRLASGAVAADEVVGTYGETLGQELALSRQFIAESAAELKTVIEGGVANFKNFLINGSEYVAEVVAEEIEEIVHGIDPAKYGVLGAASRIASANPAAAGAPTAAPGAAVGEGAAVSEGAAAGEGIAAGEGVAAGESLAATGEGVAASGALSGEAAAAGGALTGEAAAGGAAVGEAVGAGATATEAAGGLAGIGLGPIVIGGLVILGLVGGGIYLWNRTHAPAPPPPTHVTGPQQPGAPNPPNTTPPEPSNPAAPQPGPAAPFDVNGTYNGTLNGAVCASPECFITLTKQDDATGPDASQAGHITILFTAVNYTPAFTGVASRINERIGPMAASLAQDGTVQGSGTTTETDTSPGGGGATATGQYAVTGNVKDATTGSPSYVLHLTLDGAPYDFTGAR
ncbi:hypothetical protein IPZ58_26985 [Streptomyces roseoverticillatus]|uniref:hypothetical protein n=1 Tax=Streptomyces roseoverticillatus TaxID=66429 RepID=UPI001F1F02F6|nr:hypothetical protein [Streptomyces roseoverticillatus]MCF3105209.1 hypothetical protein [Streptomyces roseoverticillatus]